MLTTQIFFLFQSSKEDILQNISRLDATLFSVQFWNVFHVTFSEVTVKKIERLKYPVQKQENRDAALLQNERRRVYRESKSLNLL